MVAFKVILALLFVISGGAIATPRIKAYLRKHAWLQITAWAIAALSGLYFVVGLFSDVDGALTWAYRRLTIGPYTDRDYSVAECDNSVTKACVTHGGAFGDVGALNKIRACKNLELVPSSAPSLGWKSLWITNVYSYAPGGGGPGGGLIDDVLKVGGWGDWYFSLIKFDLPARNEMNFAGVLLFAHHDEQETIPLYVDRIIEQWKWDLTTGHVWWKDRPGGFPILPESLPPPQKTHWYVIEITKLYNQWANGNAGNYGFQIRPATNYGSIIRFANNLSADKSKIPRLVLCQR